MLLSFCPTSKVCFSHLRSSSYQSPSYPPASDICSLSSSPATAIRFRTSYREKLAYLRNLGIVDSNPKSTNVPSHASLDRILTIIKFLKSKGFSDSDIPKLTTSCPKLLSDLEPADIGPVFSFLATDVAASTHESCGLILCCPDLLFSNVDYCLRPTLAFLTSIGLKRLNSPTNLNAHLLNTRVSKFETKRDFLRSIGFTYDESIKACTRLPAIFGYSIENNMAPKVEYLVEGMQRSIDEIKEFPQYFAFSLRRRIVPRHMHLMQRSVHISLKKMLLCGDDKFYAKWK
ncbi:transcription termination factor MTEF1, chloroplastic-like [Chenopodium quinoa]|uniref:transcription termination factor MTEF1, chloroplastic-like n=1 Tax=Chenopodium quinoa TaxID=63459 RepID=UPI000B7852AC|nr:transcription termination factor MTEF1, chloroplastic-like [Chenopodium quinoa]